MFAELSASEFSVSVYVGMIRVQNNILGCEPVAV